LSGRFQMADWTLTLAQVSCLLCFSIVAFM